MDPHDRGTVGHHLFLEPSGSLEEELQGIISRLAKEYDGPEFSPHVTLLARIEGMEDEQVLEKAQALASAMRPFTLTLGELGQEDRYFRALYVCIKELEPVTAYHREARRIFAVGSDQEYLPHLSLLYGNYPEMQKRETGKSLQYPRGSQFLVDRIHVYRTPGETHRWRKIGEAKLGG